MANDGDAALKVAMGIGTGIGLISAAPLLPLVLPLVGVAALIGGTGYVVSKFIPDSEKRVGKLENTLYSAKKINDRLSNMSRDELNSIYSIEIYDNGKGKINRRKDYGW